ncbi:MAG: hypothetical protein AB8B91_24325 [Rubripirellula sp.]
MNPSSDQSNPGEGKPSDRENAGKGASGFGVCPVCHGRTLIEIRGKLQCDRCHTICETCCEGGRC